MYTQPLPVSSTTKVAPLATSVKSVTAFDIADGVEPNRQSQGYGSMLIQNILQECDRTQTPAYLESSNPHNVPFYQRHGFEVIGSIQAGSSPTMFPMIRDPR